MKRTLSALAMIALLFWSRIASAQEPCSPGVTHAEVEILAVSEIVYCGTFITDTVARVRVVRTISGPVRQGTFLALIPCPPNLRVGAVHGACVGEPNPFAAVTEDSVIHLDRFTDDPSPRICTLILPRTGPRPAQRQRPSDRAIAPRRR
jgi:hypothetical protein